MQIEFEQLIHAFKNEPTIRQMGCLKGWEDESHQDYIKKGICAHVYPKEKSVSLQFLGWELVLLNNGNYFINDTTG